MRRSHQQAVRFQPPGEGHPLPGLALQPEKHNCPPRKMIGWPACTASVRHTPDLVICPHFFRDSPIPKAACDCSYTGRMRFESFHSLFSLSPPRAGADASAISALPTRSDASRFLGMRLSNLPNESNTRTAFSSAIALSSAHKGLDLLQGTSAVPGMDMSSGKRRQGIHPALSGFRRHGFFQIHQGRLRISTGNQRCTR